LKKITDILFSFKTTLVLLAILAIGAGVATFIENDYGTSTARVLVYNHLWYEAIMTLTCINMIGIIFKYKMYKHMPRFLIHTAFVVILIGAAITRYIGYEGIIHIREGKAENRMISLEPYLQVKIKQKNGTFYQEYPLEFAANQLKKGMSDITASNSLFKSLAKLNNDFNHNIHFNGKTLNVKYVDYLVSKQGQSDMGILTIDLTLNGQTKTIRLPGKRGQKGISKLEDFGDTVVTVEYGSKVLQLPFTIFLRDFQLDRYPGSMSPSSYASEVTVVKEGKEYDYRIFMNRTLHEGNFLFFQSSYDQDEKGTVLSVNNDPGKWPTYLGYFLLTLGFVLNLFDKRSRFWKLTKYVKERNVASLLVALSLAFATTNMQAAESTVPQLQQSQEDAIVNYLNDFQEKSVITAEKFGRLVTQSNMGRMKPVNTQNREIVLKLSGKSAFLGMSADQVVLGMLSRPEVWRHVKMIKIKTPKLKKFLGLEPTRKYIAFSEVFKEGKYALQEEVNKAYRQKPTQRGTYERDLLKVDERLNIAFLTYNGNLFKIFPQVGGQNNNKWFNPLDAIKGFKDENQKAVEMMIRGFVNSVIQENFEEANKFIQLISSYQHKAGKDVMVSDTQLNNEIMFNELDIFPKLTLAYLLVGFIMLIAAFIVVFNPKIKPVKTTLFFFIALSILFFVHTFGMGFRWIVAGHAPWSNTYESMLYISWSAVFAGVVFFRKSLLALSSAIIIAAIFMFTAHLTNIDPEITNLVPVLKSYWLTIHVSILTASYGFFGLSAVICFIALIIFIFRNKKRAHLDETIKNIAAISEISLIIGLSALTVGNFLGGVWANESWGRYWGWDPKETWAYVSIVVYALVIHMRFVKALNTPFAHCVATVLAFSSIIMTYVGVNFYLSGMHSYATGDPVPIPTWAYVTTALVFMTIAIAYSKRNLKDDICHVKYQKGSKK
jgi:cytochrome c-type biogenesis protein CcsB